ncbi:LXG domain-containing protein [Halobacillus ihumii]|uniref:LXG domain-containing protein n=1 Tax=Halobacillus ihumii TaxID=2686092 RepID=UPI0013D10A79|nr:LXG domain-containing protein [Halobacillus ihumii]
MKTLHVSSFHNGINDLLGILADLKASFSNIESAVQQLVHLESFGGRGGSSIRSFYEECHQPFLQFMNNFLSKYEIVLNQMNSSLNSLEPHEQGYIDQSFIEGSLQQGLSQLIIMSSGIIQDANRTIDGIQDIVAVPSVDENVMVEQVRKAEQSINVTVQKLYEFDQQQSAALRPIQTDIEWMINFVEIINSKFQFGQLSIPNYDSNQLSALHHYHPVFPRNNSEIPTMTTSLLFFKNYGYTGFNNWISPNSNYKFDSFNYFNTVVFKHVAISKESETDLSSKDDFLLGQSEDVGEGFLVGTGFGKSSHDWEGLNGLQTDDQIGGSSSFTGLYAGSEWNTNVMDGTLRQDILKLDGQASIGGKSVLPLVKAQASGITWHGRTQLDSNLDYVGNLVGGSGIEVRGTIGNAKAYAGVDNSSIGVAAKAAVVEGEVSPIIGIPFTDINTKFTLGASAGSIGGEAKIGKETVLDLRFVFGVRLGISFETESEN